jgi:hypothetical protein
MLGIQGRDVPTFQGEAVFTLARCGAPSKTHLALRPNARASPPWKSDAAEDGIDLQYWHNQPLAQEHFVRFFAKADTDVISLLLQLYNPMLGCRFSSSETGISGPHVVLG